ncbi:MAG: PhoH family protein [Phycisphaeraceae bacterium]|nr:MAG: PhoH family protein [Phycisphaeraceae bacterium]
MTQGSDPTAVRAVASEATTQGRTGRTESRPRERDQRRPGAQSPPGAATARKESASPEAAQDIKHFVLDTNVLLHDPDSLFAFKENNVIIPFVVLEELDTFKSGNNDINRSARHCIRHLDRLRERGQLVDGVAWGDEEDKAANRLTGVIRIDLAMQERPAAISADTPDHRIIAVAYALQKDGKHTVFVTKDINARIKADALGIQAEDYENQKIDAERLYRGYLDVQTPGDLIDELYRERMLEVERLGESLIVRPEGAEEYKRRVDANQFVHMEDVLDESHSGLARRIGDTDHLVPVTAPRKPIFGIMARNIEQTMALDLLLDDEIKLVTLTGGAGTGKTLLALAAGMHKVFQEQRYDRLLVARPIMPLGRDIGFLPGDKEEKLAAWMQPIFDNLDYLLSTRGSHLQTAESKTTEQRIEKLLADGKLVLEPLTYIRGRSIPHQFMIVDEAQNLSPHEVKTIVSRVGEGTKLILTGDVEQIDHPYLDASSNGLSFVVERMRGESMVGHVTLAKSERSELASIAAARL